MPPAAPAGKNLKHRYPAARPFINSEALATAGRYGMAAMRPASNSDAVEPGEIAKAAPALAAFVVMKLGGTAVGSQIEWDLRTKLFAVGGSLNGYSIAISVIEFVVVGVLILELRRRRAIQVLRPGQWVGLGLLAIFAIMPARLLGAFFAGAWGYLKKPLSREAIASTVDRLPRRFYCFFDEAERLLLNSL